MNIDQALAKFRVLSAASKKAGIGTSTELSEALQALSRRIWALIAAGSNATGPAVLDQRQIEIINAQLDDLIGEHIATVRSIFTRGVSAQEQVITLNLEAVYAQIGRADVKAMRQARAVFVAETREVFGARSAAWVDNFRGDAVKLRSGMQKAFSEAVLEGWDQRTLANRLAKIPEFRWENLPEITAKGRNAFTSSGALTDVEALVTRANVIARTEMNNVANLQHRAWTNAAGRDWYINLNTEPVALECKEANEQPPMVWEDWVSWTASNGKGGVPSRHPNCDSKLLGVTRDVAEQIRTGTLVGV